MSIKRTTALILGGFMMAGMSACASKPGEAVMDTVRIRLSNQEIAKVPEKIETKRSHTTQVDHADLRKTVAAHPGKRDTSSTSIETTPTTTETVTETTVQYTAGGDAVIALKSDFGSSDARQLIVGKAVVGENEIYKFEAAQVSTDSSPIMGSIAPVGAVAGAFRDAAIGTAALWTANNYGKEVSAYQDYVNKWAPDTTNLTLSNDSSSISDAYSEGASATINSAITSVVGVSSVNNNTNNASANAAAAAAAIAQQQQTQQQQQQQQQEQQQQQQQQQQPKGDNGNGHNGGCGNNKPHCMLTKPQPIATISNGRITSMKLVIG